MPSYSRNCYATNKSRLIPNYELRIRITNYELRITNYELRITNYELRITNYELRITISPKHCQPPEAAGNAWGKSYNCAEKGCL